jgi:hypothetical protein
MLIKLTPPARLVALALVFFVPASFSQDSLSSGSNPEASKSRASPTSRIERVRLLAERDAYYEQCATVCQTQVDEDINNCPGAREIQKPDDSTPPLPRCKWNAVERFERCMQRCPPPPSELQG